MKRIPCAIVILAVGVFAAGCDESVQAKPAAAKVNSSVERGRYLVTIIGCNDCHSPKVHPGSMEPDPAHLLSGRPATTPAPEKPAHMGEIAVSGDLTAWYGPWGVSYAANLTPDRVTGLGKRYDEASFIRAMRTGKKPEGTDILPPMPWPDFAHMSDRDLRDIWAYLKTLKPVNNNVLVSSKAHATH
ncbi:MAG TPA: diheme cytochrome c-553 [Thermoanaerobaculia bacterium]|nr:diheme cytochrome c-553 [Thermoanaerobaculia bacterium]